MDMVRKRVEGSTLGHYYNWILSSGISESSILLFCPSIDCHAFGFCVLLTFFMQPCPNLYLGGKCYCKFSKITFCTFKTLADVTLPSRIIDEHDIVNG